jgi:hypothetical protein
MSIKDGRQVKSRGWTRRSKRDSTKYRGGKLVIKFPGRNSVTRRKRKGETI